MAGGIYTRWETGEWGINSSLVKWQLLGTVSSLNVPPLPPNQLYEHSVEAIYRCQEAGIWVFIASHDLSNLQALHAEIAASIDDDFNDYYIESGTRLSTDSYKLCWFIQDLAKLILIAKFLIRFYVYSRFIK